MAQEWQQTGTASSTIGIGFQGVKCDTTAIATNPLEKTCELAGSGGSEVTVTIPTKAEYTAAIFAADEAVGVTSIPSGTWNVKVNVTAAASSGSQIREVHICRVNSSGVSQATIASATGLTVDVAVTGVKSIDVTQGSAHSCSATDHFYVQVVVYGNSHSGTTIGITPDQLITDTITAAQVWSLDGDIIGQSTATGDVRPIRKLAGAIAAASTFVGDVKPIRKLAGAITATSTFIGDLGAPFAKHVLAGAIAASGLFTGDIVPVRQLAGTIAGQSTVTGDAVASAPNLWSNASLEYGIDDWNDGTNSTISWDTDPAWEGTHSLKNVYPSNGTVEFNSDVKSIVSESTEYTASVYIYPTNASLGINFIVKDQGGTLINSTGDQTYPAATWTRISVTFTTGVGDTGIYLEFQKAFSAEVGDINFDAFKLETGSSATPWRDGPTPIAGAIAGQSTVTGDLGEPYSGGTTWDLAGTIAGQSTVTGDVIPVRQLAGAIRGRSRMGVPGLNLWENANLESGVYDWVTSGTADPESSTEQAWQGLRSLKFTPDAYIWDGHKTAIPFKPIQPSTQYTLSLYVYVTNAAVSHSLRIRDQDLNTITATSNPHTADTWERRTITFTTGPDDSAIEVAFYKNNNVSTDPWYIDGIQLELGNTASTWEPYYTADLVIKKPLAGVIAGQSTVTGDLGEPYSGGTTWDLAGTIAGQSTVSGTITAPWFTGWGYRIPITIDADDIDATLTDWTMVFDQAFDSVLTQVNGPLDADGTRPSLNGGGDIRFSADIDGKVRIACDIRNWVTNNTPASATCEVALKIPTVSSSSDTTIYMWWGKSGETQPAASADYGQYDAYDEYHEGVWSFRDWADRTLNAYNANSTVAGDPAVGQTGGPLGEFAQFDGNDIRSSTADITHGIGTGNFAFEQVLRRDGAGPSWAGWVSLGTYNPACYLNAGGAVWGIASASDAAVSDSFWPDMTTFHHAVIYRTGTDITLRLDGAGAGSDINWDDNLPSEVINFGSGYADTSECGIASIAEFRLHTDDRSDAWWNANYHNMLNTSGFLTWGSITDLGVYSLAGTVAGQATFTGDLVVKKQLAGTIAGQSTATGNLSVHQIRQQSYRWRYNDGGEAAATWRAALNTDPATILPDVEYRLRFLIQEYGGVDGQANETFDLYYRRNGGDWWFVAASLEYAVYNTSEATDGEDTTQQLGSGSFVSNNDGVSEQSHVVCPTAIGAGQEIEVEFSFGIMYDENTDNDLFEFQVRRSDGSALDAYTVAGPSFNLTKPVYRRFEVKKWRFRDDDGTEETASWLAAENTNVEIVPGVPFRLRFLFEEKYGEDWGNVQHSSPASLTFAYYARINEGSWFQLDLGNGVDTADTQLVHQGDTTQQLGSGSFQADNDMQHESNWQRCPPDGGIAGYEYEIEIGVELDDDYCDVDDEIDLKVIFRNQSNTAEDMTWVPAFPQVTSVANPNLWPNSSFEYGIDEPADGWIGNPGWGGTPSQSTTKALFDTNSLKCLPGSSIYGGTHSMLVPVEPSTTYRVSLYLNVDDDTVPYNFRIFDQDDNGLRYDDNIYGTIDTWVRRTPASFTTGADDTHIRITFNKNNDTDESAFYIDGIKLEEGSLVTDYVDGPIPMEGTIGGQGTFTGNLGAPYSHKVLDGHIAGQATFTGDLVITTTTLSLEGTIAGQATLAGDLVKIFPNLWSNASLEYGIDDWNAEGTPPTVEQSSVQTKFGSYSIRFIGAGTYDGIKSDIKDVSESTQYTVSVWVYPASTTDLRLRVYDQDENFISGFDFDAVAGGQWTRLTRTFTTGIGDTGIVLWLIKNGDATNDYVYADGIKLELGATLTPWIDGPVPAAGTVAGQSTFTGDLKVTRKLDSSKRLVDSKSSPANGISFDAYANCEVSATFTWVTGEDVSVFIRYTDNGNYINAKASTGGNCQLSKRTAFGSWTPLDMAFGAFSNGVEYTMTIKAHGDNLVVEIDGTPVCEARESDHKTTADGWIEQTLTTNDIELRSYSWPDGIGGKAELTGDLVVKKPLAGTVAAQSTFTGNLEISTATQVLDGHITGQGTFAGDLKPQRQLAGSVAGQSTFAGDLKRDVRLVGGVTAQSTLTGDLRVTRQLAGAVTGQSTFAGDLEVQRQLAGSIAGQSTLAGTLAQTHRLIGTIAAQSTFAGDLIVEGAALPLAGDIAGQSTFAGDLKAQRPLAGTIVGQATFAGDLRGQRQLTGTIGAQSTFAGDLRVIRGLAGSVAGQSTFAGDLKGQRQLAGSIAAQSTFTGDLKAQRQLTGTIAGQSTFAGELIVQGAALPLVGHITAQSTLAGDLKRDVRLAGGIAAQSTLAGDLKVRRPLAGSIAGQSTLAGDLKPQRKLAGSIDGQSTVLGDLTVLQGVWVLKGEIAGASTFSGTLAQTHSLSGSIDATSTFAGDLKVQRRLAGSIVGQSDLAGNLEIVEAVWSLQGAVVGQSTFSGTLLGTLRLVGAIEAQSTLIGTITQQMVLAETIAAQSTFVGSLRWLPLGAWPLEGTIAAQSEFLGTLTTTYRGGKIYGSVGTGKVNATVGSNKVGGSIDGGGGGSVV